MRTFYFFPPSREEQRAFFMQFLGTLLSLVVIGVLCWRSDDIGLRGVLIGAGAGVLYLLARAAWHLENKARRAQHAEIGVEENGLIITDAQGKTQRVTWNEIEKTEVVGGRLLLVWSQGKLQFSAREVEDGMELIGLIAARGKSTSAPAPPSNFISLEPK